MEQRNDCPGCNQLERFLHDLEQCQRDIGKLYTSEAALKTRLDSIETTMERMCEARPADQQAVCAVGDADRGADRRGGRVSCGGDLTVTMQKVPVRTVESAPARL